MGRIGQWLKKAEDLARGHSKQADQLIDRAERFAKERTGHKYDQHIEKGADTIQRRYGGGQGTTPGHEQRRPDPAHPDQARPDQARPDQGPQQHGA
ncbi:antitoxin [Nonomuraea sp. NPDC049480]|uniref:antitoxin n=1 Tax=Nonomuraea sp. NPDC049480 TaxID=3364353 RepID=UPI003793D9E5